MNRLAILTVAILLQGCAIEGAPLGWGGTHEVLLANEKAVTYKYDAVVGGQDAVFKAAADHCAAYGKSPVPTE